MFEITPEIEEKLRRLQEKYDAMGQDMEAYLEGLIHSKFLTYWDYIQLETLLSLQRPRTNLPDETIFIIYHQITELYFKLIQHELEPFRQNKTLDFPGAATHLTRINNYIRHLAGSFDIMTYGMDRQQFLNFRMALLPASGFQSVQFREIELKFTTLYQLAEASVRPSLSEDMSVPRLYRHIYWKAGNREEATGKKTLTLRMFEEAYDEHLMALAANYRFWNLLTLLRELPPTAENAGDIHHALRQLDLNMNIHWRLSHYKAAARYLVRDPEVIKATGGTNWQQYLPPQFQRIIFFPGLWSEQERKEWGKRWVLERFEEEIQRAWSAELKARQDEIAASTPGE